MIHKLPSHIIENILCFLPIQEAARTSILSKQWRYHWTRIPKLVLDEYEFQVSGYKDDWLYDLDLEERASNIQSQKEGKTYWSKLFFAFHQILLKHEGPIHEFTLHVDADTTCVELDHIILYLSRNYNVKRLTFSAGFEYVLSLSLVSFDGLTDLRLSCCHLGGYELTFNVFYSLTNLYINDVSISKITLQNLISSCPLLKSLTMMIDGYQDNDDSNITNLFECFPLLENLSTSMSVIEEFAENGVPQALPVPLIHLKYVCIKDMYFTCKYGLSFLLFLIRSASNLKELKLQVDDACLCYEEDLVLSEKCSSTLQKCSDIWLEHLNVLEILDLRNEKHELDFVKFILAKSPVIKKARINLWSCGRENEKLLVYENLMSFPHASPAAVEIIAEKKILRYI